MLIALVALVVAATPTSPPTIDPPVVLRTPPPVISISRLPVVSPSVMTPSQAMRRGVVKLSASEAVMKAAEAESSGIMAVFDVPVVIANEVGPRIFLGTQEDYRDQRNLAIAIQPSAFKDLMTRYGAPLTERLKGKHLLVGGRARPVKISINDESGKPTGKYYYQTHVVVTHANQIEVVGE